MVLDTFGMEIECGLVGKSVKGAVESLDEASHVAAWTSSGCRAFQEIHACGTYGHVTAGPAVCVPGGETSWVPTASRTVSCAS